MGVEFHSLNFFDHRHAVHVGQSQIQKNQVRAQGGAQMKAFRTGGGGDNLVILIFSVVAIKERMFSSSSIKRMLDFGIMSLRSPLEV